MAQQRVGGQALANGVMLRAGRRVAVAVRRPDGTITVDSWEQRGRGRRLDRVPVVRVLAGLGAAGSGAVRASRVARRARAGTAVRRLARIAALAAFLAVAQLFAWVLWLRLEPRASVFGAAQGALAQVAALVGALALARVTRAGRRVFTYHGAEHQTVRAHELGFAPDVDPNVVARLSPVHPRCGTHLALWLTLEAGALGVVQHGALASGVAQVAIVVVSIGAVAELLRLAGDRPDWWARLVRAPGSALQLLTTRRADAAHCEVALAALRAATVAWEASPERITGMAPTCTSDSALLLSS